ncbi:8-demethyl-8-(2,3,4-trimethoxy-alpha-L-rhamnosyl)tetracenomycin-C O-methyltransferase [Pseudonocardia sediminis]|uniref:S-adenosyl-L-methionine-dependent methyltransferase n=1 Tax=Pseudonocardia sediminis TaxID=1397368 RepID=A0A4Q7V0I8_PSEST|nr:SAM-dependent methyltransferase [Pseudonocardia sediminis]RZT85999.1 8-demethyl-8-(2,3,4-trimethoxy-alpha-L-rhamnosyl)tetracenomycin-C O-methyltransferase [Pseudonocardia sediminis]
MTSPTTGHTPTGGNSVAGPWNITTSVGLTALAVSAARAVENTRDDALVHDRYATDFVHAANPSHPLPTTTAEVDSEAWVSMVDFMAVRSRALDDLLLDATRSGIDQVVVLAAGLDVRAQRLDWPAGTTVFEIDQDQVLDFKQQVLDADGATPSCTRRAVPCDLRDDWPAALADAGFDHAKPTVWLAEGLLPYLPAQAEADLFAAADKLSAPGSRMAVEALGLDVADRFLDSPEVAQMGASMGCDMRELWNTERRTDAPDELQGLGWTVSHRTLGELASSFDRTLGGSLRDIMAANRIIDARR